MKISKKNLKRLILENILEEEDEAVDPVETSAEADDTETDESWIETVKNLPDSILSTVEDMADVDIDRDGTVGKNPVADTNAKAEPSSPKKITKNDKTAYIQKVIKSPSSEDGTKDGDGQWGKGTTKAWKAWIVEPSTIEKIKALKSKNPGEAAPGAVTNESFLNQDLRTIFNRILNEEAEENTDEITKFIKANAGNAAKVAAELGYSPNLSGVTKMVRELEALPKTSTDDSQKSSKEEPESESNEEVQEGNPEDQGSTESEKGEVYELSSLKLDKSRFQHNSNGNLTNIKQERKAEILSTEATIEMQTALAKKPAIKKIFDFDDKIGLSLNLEKLDRKTKKDKMFFSDNKIIIRRATAGDVTITNVKIDGNFIVAVKEAPVAVEESLSHGALIRKRYRRY